MPKSVFPIKTPSMVPSLRFQSTFTRLQSWLLKVAARNQWQWHHQVLVRQKCRASGPTPDPHTQNLHCNKTPLAHTCPLGSRGTALEPLIPTSWEDGPPCNQSHQVTCLKTHRETASHSSLPRAARPSARVTEKLTHLVPAGVFRVDGSDTVGHDPCLIKPSRE